MPYIFEIDNNLLTQIIYYDTVVSVNKILLFLQSEETALMKRITFRGILERLFLKNRKTKNRPRTTTATEVLGRNGNAFQESEFRPQLRDVGRISSQHKS